MYPHHSRPVEKCIGRRIKQRLNEAGVCIIELHTEENKGGSIVRGGHQILIKSADFHLQLWGYLPMRFCYWRVFSYKLMEFWEFVKKRRCFNTIGNILDDAFENTIVIQRKSVPCVSFSSSVYKKKKKKKKKKQPSNIQ